MWRQLDVDKNESYEKYLRDQDERQKQLDAIVNDAMTRVTSQIAARQPPIHSHFFYGATAIHPKHLVTWYVFRTDSEWRAAKRSGLTSEIEAATRAELAVGGYPVEGVDLMTVSFTSKQDIQRKSGGNDREYFK